MYDKWFPVGGRASQNNARAYLNLHLVPSSELAASPVQIKVK